MTRGISIVSDPPTATLTLTTQSRTPAPEVRSSPQ
jgi:hypothetical protein